MGGGIISSSLKLFRTSFKEYLDYYINSIAVLSFLFAIFSFIFNLILSTYDLTNIIKTNLYLIIGTGIFLIIVILIHYHYWYKNNFNDVTIDKEALLLIEGRDNNHLSIEISNLIVPSEDLLILTLIIEFGEFIREELLNKTYTLLIKKPADLEIKFLNNIKLDPYIIDNGFNSSFYCINIKYTNNIRDKISFELQADKTTYGDFDVYFLNEDLKTFENKNKNKKENITKKFEEISSKKSSIFNEDIYSKDIEIENKAYIIIDKKEE